jgi:hypothetical protein
MKSYRELKESMVSEGFKQVSGLQRELGELGLMQTYRKLIKQLKDSPGKEISFNTETPGEEYTKRTQIGKSAEVKLQDISGGTYNKETSEVRGDTTFTTRVIAINDV